MTKEPRIYNGEKGSLFNKQYQGKWTATYKRVKLDHYPTSYSKINSKWSKDFNVRPEALKHLKENTGGAPRWLSGLSSAFGSGHNLKVLGSSPALGFLLRGVPASTSPSPGPTSLPTGNLSGKKKKKYCTDVGRDNLT